MKRIKPRHSLLDIFKDKRVRYGGYAAIVTLSTVVILLVVNLIFQQLNLEVDMTENRLFSLSEQTLDYLDELTGEVVIYGLYSPGNESANVTDVLDKYEAAGDLISVQILDPEKNPLLLQRYTESGQNLSSGTLVVEQGDRYRVIPAIDLYDVTYSQQGEPRVIGFRAEQRITNALFYVNSGYSPKLYVLAGHGEFTLTRLGLQQTVEKENYEIATLNLQRTPQVPDDADVVLVLSPESDLTEVEADALREYLEADGSAMFFFDFYPVEFTYFNELLGSFGIELVQGIVMESDADFLYDTDNPFFIAPNLVSHEITDPLNEDRLTVLMPYNMAVRSLEAVRRNIEIEPLLLSSDQSWMRTDTSVSSPSRQESDDPGPHTLAMAVSRKPQTAGDFEGFRLIAAGNAQFVGQIQYFGNLKPNVDFFLNSLSWLNKRSETISVRSKSLFELPLRMSATVQVIYAAVFIVVIPLGILIVGVIVWLRRRHL